MLKFKKLLAISVLAIACATASGQSPYFKNYKVRDGLPSNNVYFVLQDSKGYIWLCTDLGVSRFDGAHFTNYTTADGLTDNEVFTCFEDRQGRIWFATLNGKPCFFQQGKMHSEADTPLLQGFDMQGLIVHIFQEETGEVVMASSRQTGKLDLDKNTVVQWPNLYGIQQIWGEPGTEIGTLANDELGYLTNEQFTQTAKVVGVKLPIKHAQSGDTLFVVFARKLLIYDMKQRRISQDFTLPSTMNEAISISVYGNRLWVGDRKGVYLFDKNSLALQRVFLPESQVSASIEDREGGWWFSTLTDGIFYVPAPDILQFAMPPGEPILRINCLSSDARGRLWLGMNESTYGILDHNALSIHHEFPTNLKPRAINTIRHLPDGTALLAGKAGILRIKGGGQRSFFRLRSSDANMDQAGNIWSGLTGIFFLPSARLKDYEMRLDEVREELNPIFYVNNPPDRLSDLRVDHIVFDHENTPWLASPNGLYFYKKGKVSAPVLPYATRDLLFEEKTQTIWALTEANGLFVLRNGEVLDSILIVGGQGNAICRDLCHDGQGDHWIATASGLFKVAGDPGHLRLFDYANANGMGAEKLNAVAVLGGQVFMGKDDGLMAAPLSIFAKKLPPPPIYLTGLSINGSSMPLDKPLSLGFGENSLIISFEGLSFKDYKQLHYRYRLTGHDPNWHTTTNEAVEYASLRPGQYQFEVVAVNSSGVESKVASTFAFSIAKPFWMYWWFFAALFLAFAALVYVWVKRRERKLRHKYEMQRRLMETENEKLELQKKNADLKMLALRLQMNPHFIFNALNTIKGYYGQEKFTQANSYIAKFARLLRLNLDYSDAFIPLDQEIELLRIYMQLSQIRYPDKMDFKVEVAEGIVPSATLIPSMVIQAFIENAVIHGIVSKQGRGLVSLQFVQVDSEIVATVRDDGVGRSASAAKLQLRDPHKPLATNITLERLELLRKNNAVPALEINDIFDENRDVAGTEVIIRLPIQPQR